LKTITLRAIRTSVLGLEEIPVTSDDVQRGLEIEEALGTRNLFDRIHVGTMLERMRSYSATIPSLIRSMGLEG